jgi:uncharacterized protein with HEPN domain
MPMDDELCLRHMREQIQVVGEAASHISQEAKAAHPEIPWQSIVGMRDRIVHCCFAVDEDVFWKTLTTELEPLLLPLAQISKA